MLSRVTLCLAALLLASCATIFQGTDQSVQIYSNPPGAQVLVSADGIYVATVAPASVRLTKGKDVVVSFLLPGYRPLQVHLERSVWSGGFIADLCLVNPLLMVVDLGAMPFG